MKRTIISEDLKEEFLSNYSLPRDKEFIDFFGQVSQLTEEKVNKLIKTDCMFSEIIDWIWNELRNQNSIYLFLCEGYKSSVKRLKDVGEIFQNKNVQVGIPKYLQSDGLALTAIFGCEVINTVTTNDLSHVTISDFNLLIRKLYKRIIEDGIKWQEKQEGSKLF